MAQTYLLFGDSELRQLVVKLEPLVSAWASQWLHEVHFDIHCSHAVTPTETDGNWQYAKPNNGLGIFVQSPARFTNELVLAMFGNLAASNGVGNTLSPLVIDCAQEALIDLISEVLHALTPTQTTRPLLISETPEQNLFLEGNGSIQILIQSSNISLLMLVPGPLSEAFLRATTKQKSEAASATLANPMDRIKHKTLKLTAILGDAEIDIGTLQKITVGDIIRLDTPINKPASLFSDDGTLLCRGYLGSHESFKSLQLNR